MRVEVVPPRQNRPIVPQRRAEIAADAHGGGVVQGGRNIGLLVRVVAPDNNGAVLEKSFKTSEKFPEPDVEMATVSFLYSDADGFHFMDQSSYEQFTISDEGVGDDRFYLKEGLNLELFKYNGQAVSLQLPQYVELAITSTEPGVRGDTAAGGATKVAKLETGLEVRVALFMKEGELVRVNTQTGEVAGRA